MADRLYLILPSMICSSQKGFVKGRSAIVDGPGGSPTLAGPGHAYGVIGTQRWKNFWQGVLGLVGVGPG